MLYAIPTKNNQTERERYLSDELDRMRDEQSLRNEREYQEREAARRTRFEEYERQIETHLRSADNWHEALKKQHTLCSRESSLIPVDEGEPDYFAESADACEYALAAWKEEQAKIAGQLAELQRQIEKLNYGLRSAVGQRLKQHTNGSLAGWVDVATTLLDEDASIDDWLNW